MTAEQFDLYFECRLAFVDLPDARIRSYDLGASYGVQVFEDRRAQYTPGVRERFDPADPNQWMLELWHPPPVEMIPPLVTRASIMRHGVNRYSACAVARRLRRERDLGRARLTEHAA